MMLYIRVCLLRIATIMPSRPIRFWSYKQETISHKFTALNCILWCCYCHKFIHTQRAKKMMLVRWTHLTLTLTLNIKRAHTSITMPLALCVFSSFYFRFLSIFLLYAIINFNNTKPHIHWSNANGKIRFQFSGIENGDKTSKR